MYGYKLQKPKTVPNVIWACKTKVEQYSWQNRNKPNMIEFGICKSSKRMLVMRDRPPEPLTGATVSCLFEDEPCQSYAEDGIPVEILSVAVSFDALEYVSAELDIEDMADQTLLLLPRIQTAVPEQVLTRLETLFYQIIELYKEHTAAAELMCAATVMRLMFELDGIARQGLRSKRDKYVPYYVAKAESILLHRYAERITVKGIAEELSISPNYLSAIFKTATGIGFCDRLLEIRMKKAAMLLGEGRSEAETAEGVGYDELGHFRRRFKQYFGVTIRDYCCINKEFTLYHAKPEKRPEG